MGESGPSPSASMSGKTPYPGLTDTWVLTSNKQTRYIFTKIRDRESTRADFIFYADRMVRLLVEEGLGLLPFREIEVTTDTGSPFAGCVPERKICCCSILRAGEAMENGLRQVCKDIKIGKILIQRDERTATPELYYSKLPLDIAERYVLLLDPMCATGGSAVKATEVLLEAGVDESRIIFINLISCPEGIAELKRAHPKLKILTGYVDPGMDERKYIVPGLGDFGDKYFGTV